MYPANIRTPGALALGVCQLSPVFAHVLNDPLKRLDKAFNNFYRRVKEGAKEKGYPRFQG
jgi:hypothetical protein